MGMDAHHLGQLPRTREPRPGRPPGRRGRTRPRPIHVSRTPPRGRPPGDPPAPLGRGPRRPRRALPAQGTSRPSRRSTGSCGRARPTCRSTPDRAGDPGGGHPGRRRGQRRSSSPPSTPPNSGPTGPSTAPCPASSSWAMAGPARPTPRPGTGSWPTTPLRRSRRPIDRRGRPRVHPLYLGLDRPAQGRDALARQRLRLPRLVRPDVRAVGGTTASPRTRRSISTCRSSTSTPRAGRGATLVLIGESTGKDPSRLAGLPPRAIRSPSGIRPPRSWPCWRNTARSTPRLPRAEARAVRGRGLPDRPLAEAPRGLARRPILWNLYGPTETNVCTAFAIPEAIDDDQRSTPFPIGSACPPAMVEGGRRDTAGPSRRGRSASWSSPAPV